jgi:hypothetical protein
MKKAWLRCEVHPGMFSDEVVVEVVTKDGASKSFFVSRNDIDDGKVRVQVTMRNGIPWVMLPTAHPYNAIPVRKTDLIEETVAA